MFQRNDPWECTHFSFLSGGWCCTCTEEHKIKYEYHVEQKQISLFAQGKVVICMMNNMNNYLNLYISRFWGLCWTFWGWRNVRGRGGLFGLSAWGWKWTNNLFINTCTYTCNVYRSKKNNSEPTKTTDSTVQDAWLQYNNMYN
jgi:hypothetical protein